MNVLKVGDTAPDFSCKNQHGPLSPGYVLCPCAHSNDKIIDFLYAKIMKIDKKNIRKIEGKSRKI